MSKLSKKPRSPAIVRAASTVLVAGSLVVVGCGDDDTTADSGPFTVGIAAPDGGFIGSDAPSMDAGEDAEVQVGVPAPDAGADAGD